MKILTYFILIFFATVTSCKKSVVNSTASPGPTYFELIGKDGKNMIRSVKDSLRVTFVLNGAAQNSNLNIYKVEVSATDTTSVSKYNGFVVSDRNPQNKQGYMSDPSSAGVRNFTFYLNGVNIGTVYFDYWGSQWAYTPPASFATFTFNNIPATPGTLQGVFIDGPLIEYYTGGQGNNIFVFQQ